MELRHLRYLIAVAEELHFGRAATRLNVSQPPLSRQIKQLEVELGVKLLHRTKREVRLTDAGAKILNEANHVLSVVDHLTRVAARASEGGIGHLAVSIPGGVNQIPIEALRVFAKRYPDVRIELKHLNTGSQIESLREGLIHAGFLNLPVREAGFVLETVSKGPLWIALPKGHPLGRYRRVPLKGLREQGFIMFARRVNPGLHDVMTGICRKAGFSINVVHEVDNLIGALTLVSADLGVSFCTTSMEKAWPDIVFRPVDSSVEMRQAVAYRRDLHSPVLDAFLEIVRQIARKNRGLRT
jgi:DNA-binding transcriptional LysR family regulator